MKAKRGLPVFVLLAAIVAVGCGDGGGQSGYITAEAKAEADSASRMNIVLAVVGDVEITAGAVREHMLKRVGADRVEEYMGNPDILQVAMAALVDQYVWSYIAKREGVKLNPEELRRLTNLESELLASHYVAEVVEKKAMPSRADVEAYYNENQASYIRPVRVGVRHILVSRREEADAIKSQLDAGGDFGALARQHSLDENTRDLGGALGFLSAGKSVLGIGRDRDFEQYVLAMDVGQTGVVRTAMGFHVVKVEKKEGGDLQPLGEVYDAIAQKLLPRRFGAIYNEELAAAREETKTRYITENFEAFTGVQENTKRLLELAATVTEVPAKAEAYRRIAYDFPDSREAPEALFRMAYVHLVEEGDKAKATNGLKRLARRHARNPWNRAGKFLLENIDQDPAMFGTPEEIFAETNQRTGR